MYILKSKQSTLVNTRVLVHSFLSKHELTQQREDRNFQCYALLLAAFVNAVFWRDEYFTQLSSLCIHFSSILCVQRPYQRRFHFFTPFSFAQHYYGPCDNLAKRTCASSIIMIQYSSLLHLDDSMFLHVYTRLHLRLEKHDRSVCPLANVHFRNRTHSLIDATRIPLPNTNTNSFFLF